MSPASGVPTPSGCWTLPRKEYMKRNTSVLPPLMPAVDLPIESTHPQLHGSTETAWLRKLLASERRRHASVEQVLTRMISQLERQVEDLRNLYFETIALLPTSPMEKP